jgi:hypothetical protein
MADTERGDASGATGARLVLGTGVLLGLLTAADMALDRPHMLGVNLRVYRLAAAALSGGDTGLYAVTVAGFPQFGYVYPPVVAVAFVPFAVLDPWPLAYAVHLVGSVAAAAALGWALVRTVERRRPPLPTLDRALVVAFSVASIHAVPTLFYGNVNLHLALALALGVLALDRARPVAAGVAFAVPALLKAFPAAFGLWLVARRRWRAVGAAVATGVVALAASVALFGVETHVAYVETALLPRRSVDFAGGLPATAAYVTLRRPVSVLFPWLSSGALAAVTALALAPPVGAVLARADGPNADLLGLFAVVAGVLLALPTYPVYYVFLAVPLVPLLYLFPDGKARRVFVAGALLGTLVFTLALPARYLPVAPGGDLALAVLRPALTLGTPPLYGTLAMLGAAVAVALRSGGRP